MKLADRTVEVHSAGVNSTNQFTIAQTSKMFKILSDSLYKDKVMAVIRELSTNAYDSHVSAGNPNPFRVTLPNQANPNFVVRDYGTGLSQEDMEQLYTTYGASNKNDSNDFVGCLGLGSKSPFAYTRSFTTSSYFNGKKYTYIAAIDDSGVPSLNLFTATDTDEDNGLEISFAVKQYDFSEFSQKAVRVFSFFKNKPIIIGGSGYDFTKEYSNRNIVISGDGWRVCKFNNDTSLFPNHYQRINTSLIAIMGNIAYPIESDQLIGEEKASQPDHIQRWNRAFGKSDIASWKNFVSETINQGMYLELDFGIGELEMDVSREGLQYTKQVVKTLREKTQGIYLELKKEFSKKLDEAKTLVEAYTTYHSLNDLAGGWGVGASWTDENSKVHDIGSGSDIEYKLQKDEHLYVFNYRSAGYRSRRLVYLTDRIHHDTLNGKGQYYWNSNRKTGPLTFFWSDVKSEESAKKIVTRYCNTNDCFAYLLVRKDSHDTVTDAFKKLVKDVGESNILNVSDYKHLTASSGTRSKSSKDSPGRVSDQDVFLIHGQKDKNTKVSVSLNSSNLMYTLTDKELDSFIDSDEIIYVPIVRYEAASTDTPFICNLVSMFNNDKLKSFFKNDKVYAIKKSFVSSLEKQGCNLVSIQDYIKRKVEEINTFAEDSAGLRHLIDFCNTSMARREDRGYWYRHGDTEKQFAVKMLGIFGLEYKKHINNDDFVTAIDHMLVTDYFSERILTSYDHKLIPMGFNKSDYENHMTDLLSNLGIHIKIGDITKHLNILNELNIKLNNMCEDETANTELAKLITKNKTKQKVNILECEQIREKVKKGLDNNPMLQYIMETEEISGNLSNYKYCPKNVLGLFDGRNHYGSQKSDMSEDASLLFRVQLSSLIK